MNKGPNVKTTLSDLVIKSFITAAKENNLQTLEEMSRNYLINHSTAMLALDFAALHGHIDIVDHILDNVLQSPAGEHSVGYFSAIYAAAKTGDVDILNMLLTHRRRRVPTYRELGIAFNFAFDADRHSVVQYLAEKHPLALLRCLPTMLAQGKFTEAHFCLEFADQFLDITLYEALEEAITVLEKKKGDLLKEKEELLQKDANQKLALNKINHFMEQCPVMLNRIQGILDTRLKKRVEALKQDSHESLYPDINLILAELESFSSETALSDTPKGTIPVYPLIQHLSLLEFNDENSNRKNAYTRQYFIEDDLSEDSLKGKVDELRRNGYSEENIRAIIQIYQEEENPSKELRKSY